MGQAAEEDKETSSGMIRGLQAGADEGLADFSKRKGEARENAFHCIPHTHLVAQNQPVSVSLWDVIPSH